MQKILFITAYPPNHRSGGQSFSSNVIRELSNKYLIDLIYFSYAEHEIDITELINKIIVLKPSMFNCFKLPFVFPLFTRRYNKIINSFIQSIAPQYSVIYFDYSQVGFYSLHITHPNKIIRCHDVIAQKISRTIPLLESWVKYSEGKILKSANTIFVPSQKDTDLIYNYYGIQSIFTNEYLHDFIFPDNILLVRSFIFFGLWSRKENLNGLVWFIKKVYPLLDKSIKDKLVVMGGGLPDVINIKYLKPNNIQYLGYVKDSYSQIINSSAVIVPLFEGAGVKVKVLDSFTTGTPVIGNNIAFEGLPVIEGLTLMVKTSQEFAIKINTFNSLSLLEKIELRNRFIQIYDRNHLVDYL